MSCQLPKVIGTLSSATSLGWQDLDQTVAQLIYLDVTPAGATAFTGAWTEVDPDGKVNISGGVVNMDGGNAATHGLYLTAGLSVAEGVIEFDSTVPAASGGIDLGFGNAAALVVSGAAGTKCVTTVSGALYLYFGASAVVNLFPITSGATYYTFRLYIKRDVAGTWKMCKVTVQGGTIATETTIGESNYIAAAISATFYPSIMRYVSSAGNTVNVKNFYWKSGYATNGPYTEYIHDAGVGKIFDNFDMTALVMPASMASTNLKFAWSFDDGTASYSSWLTLAGLNAVGKQTARKRYIRLRVQSNSDGSTQAYAAKPNSDTAIDGIFDSTMLTLAEEATRNTDMAVAKVELAYPYVTRGVARVGELSTGLLVPDAIEITSADGYSSTVIRVHVVWAANAASIQVYRSATIDGTYSLAGTITSGNYFDDTGRTAGTDYYYKARGVNATGNGAYGSIKKGTTKTTAAYLTRIETAITDMVNIMTLANGYWYNWVSSTQRDMAKVAQPSWWADLFPQENTVDALETVDTGAYHQVCNLVIYSSARMSTISANPKEAYKAELAKMNEDFKKVFGNNFATDQYSIALYNEIVSIRFLRSDSVWDDAGGDALVPGKLKSEWEITYTQNRLNPNIAAV